MSRAKITWYGHSCFRVELCGSSVVVDPYAVSSVPGLRLPDLTADAVVCTHWHSDHCASERVLLTGRPVRFQMRSVDSYHDHHMGAHRGRNRIWVFEGDGLRVVHLGDQGCPLTPEQIQEIGRPDVLMLPVGGYITIDSREAGQVVDALQPVIAVPMHYRKGCVGYDSISTVDGFLESGRPVRYAGTDSFSVEPGQEPCILMPKLVQ